MIIFLYFRKLFYIHIKLFKEIQQEFKTSESKTQIVTFSEGICYLSSHTEDSPVPTKSH